MISENYHCIFVHIPKTAGQSVEHFFLALHGLSWQERASLLLRRNPDPKFGPERLAHLKATEYVDCGHIPDEKFRKFFKFSFVRNPWDKLVSVYRYKGFDKNFSFKEFVTSRLPAKDNYSGTYRHVTPQHEFLCNANGELLVDFVGKFENLQSDFDLVCSKLGISSSLLPHVNSSEKKKPFESRARAHYTSYYDDELRETVGEIYARDISLFNYKFN